MAPLIDMFNIYFSLDACGNLHAKKMLEDDTVYPNKPVCEFSRGYQENAQYVASDYADGVLWQKDNKKSMLA